jgi:hypothetical protein
VLVSILRCSVLGLASAAILTLAPRLASAATYTVTVTLDTYDGVCDADCSIRDAISVTNAGPGGDVIHLPAGTIVLTRPPADPEDDFDISIGDLDVERSVTIQGAGESLTTIDANGIDRVFHLRAAGGNIELRDMAITGGSTTARGGGVLVVSGPALVLWSIIDGNDAAEGGAAAVGELAFLYFWFSAAKNNTASNAGGAIYNENLVFLDRSAIGPNNSAGVQGGGIYDVAGMVIENSTIAKNTSPGAGGVYTCPIVGAGASWEWTTIAQNTSTGGAPGGVIFDGGGSCGLTVVANSIIGDNTLPNCGDGAGGAATLTVTNNDVSDDDSCGMAGPNDLVDVADLGLGPLGPNGGFTDTVPLEADSVAVDHGVTLVCPSVDQRGATRPEGPECDVGAFEGTVPETVPALGLLGLLALCAALSVEGVRKARGRRWSSETGG